MGDPQTPLTVAVVDSLKGLGCRVAVVSTLDALSAGQNSTLTASIGDSVLEASERTGGMDAAIALPFHWLTGAFEDSSHQQIEELVRANVIVPAVFLQRAVSVIRESSSSGRLISVCDAVALRGLSNSSFQAASQAALLALMRSLSQEYAPVGLTSNSVVRGWFEDTPGRGPDEVEENRLLRYIPMKRFGLPEDLVGVLAYLVSSESSFVTGTSIAVDGGVLKHL
jgi:NAD(P)-dependent dehydrogenase (short-subunit alcohol dehydrogenase family)